MAKVTADNRKKSGFGDGAYPVSTKAQARSAIKLRHNSKNHSSASVLSHVASAARSHGWDDITAAVGQAREADKEK